MDQVDIEEFFAPIGPVRVRSMFGGKGIYAEGRIIALEVNGDLLLKADAESAPRFAEAGATQWVYAGRPGRKAIAMPYWSVPEDALDDIDARAEWLGLAIEAAERSERAKRRRTPQL